MPQPEAPAPTEEAAPTESRQAATPGDTVVTLADVRTMWPAVLEAVKSRGRVLWMKFSDAVPVSLEAGVLAVGIPDAGRLKATKASPAEAELAEIVSAVMHGPVTIDSVLVDSATTLATEPGAPVEPDAPSIDDEDAADAELTGEPLAIAELGATVIGEITEG